MALRHDHAWMVGKKKLHHNMNKHVNDHVKMWKEELLWKNGCFKLKCNHCCNNTGSFSESLLSHQCTQISISPICYQVLWCCVLCIALPH